MSTAALHSVPTAGAAAVRAPGDRAPGDRAPGDWAPVCRLTDLVPERGVAALLDDAQVALFLLHDGSLHAVDHLDPCSGAHVMARGIVGTATLPDGTTVPTVASPMYKQVFDLRTGGCLTEPDAALRVWQVRVAGDVVLVAVGTP